MKFRTEIPPLKSERPIQHDDSILSLGSCFAEHMVEKLSAYKFNVVHNPFGTTYNPLSLADQLNAIRSSRTYDVVDLEKANSKWFSFDHHGSYSDSTAALALEKIEADLSEASSKTGKYTWTILSLGTAWAWFVEDKVVNNCHQLPESHFDFRMLEIDEMFEALQQAMEKWNEKNPENVFILTVSPVRHLRSGMVDNNRSKARLIELAHLLTENVTNSLYYPSYEMVMDDLRDYRFFDSSLTHPSSEAVEYIWEHFSNTFFTSHTKEMMNAYEGFRKALWHKPRQTSGPAFEGHLQSLEKKFMAWTQRWPEADWTPEKLRWNELLKLG